ncbi:peptidylprolyl isomerase [Oceanihabitans sediminis]|uniref:peptidylprolyl isomerase n=1 Tax=Oceanihabitans sediminis TaxID=1812012 RepID=A0A368P265_9FLAO|nr:peptidylprolyl isomerase [Oceanihabitans sediminis]MDX1277966.1 peptidylprolyl isomerase [Oceanihabitans sediminis]MDX1774125.1 peptidylprolyl isomerase [Oceanihabitans sediminis]RBP30834.1 cyclophilin family peptidyl-prolyl cis-trans isomerase [Oceanihabitans sediminis]RCU56942.1 peptidylprolyl isomerase [Oceanihabitans sediminis]
MKIFILALLLSATSCQDKYPDLEDGLYAEFVTNKGTMVAKLYFEKAPVTVANFVALAEGTHPNVTDSLKGKRYYNGIIFHRVIDKFMIQGGDPTGTGAGDPGYKFTDEFHVDLRHNKPGILSMANSGANTNGSQFFITEGPTPNLDAFDAADNPKNCGTPGVSCHAVFGELVIGLDVQDTISNVATQKPANRPIEDVVINELNIIRKGKAAIAFDAPKVYTEELPKIAERNKKLKEEAEAKLKEEAKAATENFLKKNEDLEGTVKKLPTGLVMIVNGSENATKPKSTDKVLINYAGYFENGTLFDTSWAKVAKENNQYNEQRDKQGGYKPFPMIYNETATLIPGFREAMLNMKVGDKARVFIPSYLGYGSNGAGPIPPNTNLVFDLEIMGIQ